MKTVSKIFEGVLAVSLLFTCFTLIAGPGYNQVRSFGPSNTGIQPYSGIILGRDGKLYGTTQGGGLYNRGTVFRLNVDGSGYTLLHQFSTNYDGQNPAGTLTQGIDGALYGTTVYGGSNLVGTIFTIRTNGENYSALHHFQKTLTDGQCPYDELMQGPDGTLYGTTSSSLHQFNTSTNIGLGTVFKLSTDGTGYSLLHSFPTNYNPSSIYPARPGQLSGLLLAKDRLYVMSNLGTTGLVLGLSIESTNFNNSTNYEAFSAPLTNRFRFHLNGLRLGNNGLIYGTMAYTNGTRSNACLFAITTNGAPANFTPHYFTNQAEGLFPNSKILQGVDGNLFGTTMWGGTNGAGVIYKVNEDGTGYTVLYHFKTNGVDGCWPQGALAQGSDGTIYGTTLRGGPRGDGTVFSIKPDGSDYRQIFQFNTQGLDGEKPAGELISDGQGSLFGVTRAGGNGGNGTIFKTGLDGSGYTTLYHFRGTNNGQWPSGQLLKGFDSALYGTTFTAGTNNSGTLFKINADGSGFTTLHHFSKTNHGEVPCDGLVQDVYERLYGVTAAGGTNLVGTIYSIAANGIGFTVLHNFLTNKIDGASPSGGLFLGSDQFLYGLTENGGTNGAGTIYKINSDGTGYSILHHFLTNGVDGTIPCARLLQSSNGALVGATLLGGTSGAGTIFSINPDGSDYKVLQNLTSPLPKSLAYRHGSFELYQVANNAFYGTVYESLETNTPGSFFQIDAGGRINIHEFGTNTDGSNPSGRLALVDNKFYGVTEAGGEFGSGTLYSYSPSAPDFAVGPYPQTVIAGTKLFIGTQSTAPVDYEWYFNTAPIPGATSPDLQFTAARTNTGLYSLFITNMFGSKYVTGGMVTVLVPLQTTTPHLLPNGSLELSAAYIDDIAITPEHLSRIRVQVSTNLTSWVDLNNGVSISNGKLILNDPDGATGTKRFYRFVEWH